MPQPSDSNADANDGTTAHREARRALARLRLLATRLDHQACLIRNSGFNPQAEAEAGRLADDAFAIRWALRRIAPATEAVGQVFDAMQGLSRNC